MYTGLIRLSLTNDYFFKKICPLKKENANKNCTKKYFIYYLFLISIIFIYKIFLQTKNIYYFQNKSYQLFNFKVENKYFEKLVFYMSSSR